MHDVTVKQLATYVAILQAKYYNFKQNIEHNRLGKRIARKKMGENKSKIGSSLNANNNIIVLNLIWLCYLAPQYLWTLVSAISTQIQLMVCFVDVLVLVENWYDKPQIIETTYNGLEMENNFRFYLVTCDVIICIQQEIIILASYMIMDVYRYEQNNQS